MTDEKKEAIEYILGQIDNCYVDLCSYDQDSIDIILEAIYVLLSKDKQNNILLNLAKEGKLLNCPYSGRKAEIFKGEEMSDTSRVHKIRCSYLNCLTIEKSLSGWSPDYNKNLEKMKRDWNVMVSTILEKGLNTE